ncbi:hypothetical protein ABHI18_011823 [Aspergillus niger]
MLNYFKIAANIVLRFIKAIFDLVSFSAYVVQLTIRDLILTVVQHDASFTRPDIAFCPDQSIPHTGLINRLLDHASDGKHLSLTDFSYYSGLRRAECKRSNGQYTLSGSLIHKMIGSGTSALMYSIFGGDIEALRVWLVDERFMDGWEPRTREALGHTVAQALATSLAVEFSIDEKQALREGDVFYHE